MSVLASNHPMYSATSSNIKISVLPKALSDSSAPEQHVFAFSYTITIENLGQDSVQLLERHWVIFSGGEQIAEVVGPGVVGVQPVLGAGEAFEYTSGAVIHDPIGSMHGSYTFRSAGGEYFQVTIPQFDLFYPLVVH